MRSTQLFISNRHLWLMNAVNVKIWKNMFNPHIKSQRTNYVTTLCTFQCYFATLDGFSKQCKFRFVNWWMLNVTLTENSNVN